MRRADEKAKQECDLPEVSCHSDPTGILKHKLHHKTNCISKQGVCLSCPELVIG